MVLLHHVSHARKQVHFFLFFEFKLFFHSLDVHVHVL